jgi:hypothetical protein
MSFSPASPVTGAPATSLTSPTYTLSADTPPNALSVQKAVTAIGGTQSGVDTSSSVSRPFTITFSRPANFKGLPPVNPVTGVLPRVPNNVWVLLTRKGVTPLTGQAPVTMTIRTEISVPAGADTADAPNVRAAMSLHCGVLWEQSNEIDTSLTTGVL